jgi:hypothetical protein
MKLALFLYLFSIPTMSIAKDRPTDRVHKFRGSYFGIFDPNHRAYFSKKEVITEHMVDETLAFLESLRFSKLLRKACMDADPSLAALIDNSGIYSALATRYRYEPIMDGKIPQQEPSSLDFFANYVRSKSQQSAFAKAVRNRFRSVENLSARIISKALADGDAYRGEPFTVGNLGGAAGDDISVGLARATKGVGTTAIRQFLYDIDDDAMKLGEELGQKFYRYEVKAMGSINIIDLKNLVGISEHLRKENVRWINSIGSSMVRICLSRLVLMKLSMLAMVVDFPHPVVPVTRTSPRSSRQSPSRVLAGSPSSSKEGTLLLMARTTMEQLPLWE